MKFHPTVVVGEVVTLRVYNCTLSWSAHHLYCVSLRTLGLTSASMPVADFFVLLSRAQGLLPVSRVPSVDRQDHERDVQMG
jgi:hypothetical protein